MKLLVRILGMIAVVTGVILAMNRWVGAKKGVVLEHGTSQSAGELYNDDTMPGFEETDCLT